MLGIVSLADAIRVPGLKSHQTPFIFFSMLRLFAQYEEEIMFKGKTVKSTKILGSNVLHYIRDTLLDIPGLQKNWMLHSTITANTGIGIFEGNFISDVMKSC